MINDTFCIFKHNVNPYSTTHKICSGINSINEITKYNNNYIIVSGDIYNIESIRKQFSIKTEVVEEIILDLYLRFGSKMPSYLEGIFVVLIINSQKIVMFRDLLSLGTIYYDFDNSTDEFIITNKIREIRKFKNLKVNTEVLPKYFISHCVSIGDTFFENIKSLKSFELFEYYLDEKRLAFSVYDDSFYKVIGSDHSDDNNIVNKAENIVIDGLQDTLSYYSNYDVINSLSGGVDSSYLQVILKTLGHNKAYTYSHEIIGKNVQEYSKDIIKYLDVEHKIVELKAENILDNIITGISVCEIPYLFEGEFLQNHMYHKIRNNEKNNVLITSGSGSDTLFGFGRPFFELKYLRNPLFLFMFGLLNESLLKIIRKKDYKRYRTIIQKLKNRTLDEEFLFTLFDSNTDEMIMNKAFNVDNLFKIHFEDIKEIEKYDLDLVEKLQRWRLIEYEINRENLVSIELCEEYGLKICFPFLNKKLLYYLSSIPMSKKIRRITSKYYMKKMLLKHLPSKYVYRKKIGQGSKNFLYFFKDDKISGLIQKIKNTKYEYFKFDCERIFSDEKYYGLAIKLINFYIWHKIFIENVDVNEIHRMM